MRDLSKAMTSFAWWTLIASMNQMLDAIAPNDEVRATLDAVGHAGDRLQRGVVDLMVAGLTLSAADSDMRMSR